MALASDIITAAFRETNLISLAATVTTAQQTEALGRLNSIISSTLGNEAGAELSDIALGGQYDQSALVSLWAPANARLVAQKASPTTVKLDPHPYEGQRIALITPSVDFAVNNFTLDANGRLIEFASTKVLNTSVVGAAYQWMYRSDTSNWVNIAALSASDPMPLPIDFDDYFIISLAKRLSPRYAQALTAESANELVRQRNLISARYRKPRPHQDMPRDFVAGKRSDFGSIAEFNAGWVR